MSSRPVSYSKSVGVLSCVSIISQSCAIDKVYLISRLQNAPWNCYFLSKLLFQPIHTLSQELLFQRMQFFRTANFQQVTRGGFRPWSTRKVHRVIHYSEIFPLNSIIKNFASKLLSQDSIEQEKYRRMQKRFRFGEINKNINFNLKFQYWISWKTNNLRLAIPHCSILFYKWQ